MIVFQSHPNWPTYVILALGCILGIWLVLRAVKKKKPPGGEAERPENRKVCASIKLDPAFASPVSAALAVPEFYVRTRLPVVFVNRHTRIRWVGVSFLGTPTHIILVADNRSRRAYSREGENARAQCCTQDSFIQ